MARTVIRNGDVVVWRDGEHALMPGAHVVIEDDRVVKVTRDEPGEADRSIDATGKLVSPGFVNCHVHAGIDTQVLMTDKGAPGYYNSGMLFASASTATMGNSGPAWTDEERRAAGLYPQVELLKSGVTTFLEIGGSIGDIDLFGELVGESGIRCYAGHGFEDATWVLDPDTGAFRYHWDAQAGRDGFRRAIAFIEEHDGDHDGRLRGAMIPARLDNCTPELLRDALEAAESLDVPISVHAAQAGFEFHEILRRTGKTPIQHMDQIGLLTPRMILGHCIYVSGPPDDGHAAGRRSGADFAAGGSSVAHSVTVFARRGIAMESNSDTSMPGCG
ncbi:MAG: amidohydrolase family protein [Thermomicrobiales bacterium]